MTRSTQELRNLWEPHCQAVHRKGLREAWEALDAVLKKHGYRPRAGETYAYNCRSITGGSGYSLHAYRSDESFTFWTGVSVQLGVACDINSTQNPYGSHLVTDMPRDMVEEICNIQTVDGVQVFRWGGYYSGNKDAMHYEVVASPAEIARGIKQSTQPKPHEEDDEVKPVTYKVSVDANNSQTAPGDEGIWVTTDFVTTHVLSGPADVHGHGLGWWPKDAIFVPQAMHDWMVSNTH